MKNKLKTKITFSFRGKNQLPLFMVIKEYYNAQGELDFAKVLFEIQGHKMRKEMKKLKKESYKYEK